MARRNFRLGLTLLLSLALGACSLEPAYHRPTSGVDNHWPRDVAAGKPGAAGKGRAAADIGWQEFFTDPQLRQLIQLALTHNRNLRIAALDIEKAQAQYRIQRSDLLPSIDATASESMTRYPAGVNAAGQSGVGSVGNVGTGSIFRYYNVGIGFTSYELDLFGRIRSLDHEALEQYFSQIDTRISTQISLVAEVANDYLSLLADQSLLRLARDTYASQKHSLHLTRRSADLGVDTALDVSQAEQAVDTAQADIAQYTRSVAQDRDALRLVLGTSLPPGLGRSRHLGDEQFLERLPSGLPSDLLVRRPDVRAAERTLIAANANIGAARAAFFPSISLTGNFGTASRQLSGLFGDGSEAWSFSPKISLPIFAAGANVANLDLAKVEKKIQVAQYQQTIQTAFREVADALAARGTLNQQEAALQHLVHATGTSFKLSRMRFRQGVDNYLSVLDSQRSHYGAEQQLIGVRLSRLQNLVTLYKVLGGGWHAHNKRGTNPARDNGQKNTGEGIVHPSS